MSLKPQPTKDSEPLRPVISSGNPDLDRRLGGGLPIGSLTLIEGNSGAGKSVLSQQLLWGALHGGLNATLFTSENTVKSLVYQMDSINLDVLDYLLLGKLRIYPVELSRLGEKASPTLMQAMKRESRADRTSASKAEKADAPRRKSDVVIVDSLTSVVSRATNSAIILNFFEECKRLCANGVTLLITLHSSAVDGELVGILRSICDANVRLRAEQDGQQLVKTLEVAKIRGATSATGAIVGFEVEPAWGMRVIPISKARG